MAYSTTAEALEALANALKCLGDQSGILAAKQFINLSAKLFYHSCIHSHMLTLSRLIT